MTIETKYNIGDEVWFQDEKQPVNNEILGIEIETYKHKQLIKYLFEQDGWFLFTVCEEDLFPTKEELLKSL